MNKKTFILFIALSALVLPANGQVAMGKWRTHFAYSEVKQMVQSENKVFVVSDISLYSIDKRDKSMELYSKVTGLSGTTIGKIGYDEKNKMLLITYRDGNIDFMSENGVKNLPDLYNKQVNSDKGVNHIMFHDNKAFLSMSFGIVELSMTKNEIQDTYYIGDNASQVKVLNTTLHNNNLIALSESDVYYAPISSPALINYETWSKMSGLPASSSALQAIHSFHNHLILLRGGKLYKQDSAGTWTPLDEARDYTHISLTDEYLLAYSATGTYVFDKQLKQTAIANLTQLQDGVYDKKNNILWLAGDAKGIAEYNINTATLSDNFYQPDGPAVNSIFRMHFAGEKLFIAPGGRWPARSNFPGQVMMFENNRWTNITQQSVQTASGVIPFNDVVSIATNPQDNSHFVAASFSSGLYEFKNNMLYIHYTQKNSPLVDIYSNGHGYLTSWVKYDDTGNLWVLFDYMGIAIRVLKSDGNWAELKYPTVKQLPTIGDFIISKKNRHQKFITVTRNKPGIGVFDDNGTIDDTSDDKSVFIQEFKYISNNTINSIYPKGVFSIAEDNNGVLWIGTDAGPFIVNHPSKVFDSDFICSRIIIPRNDGSGLGDFLLENETINAIAIDGANRKWVGTKHNGVFLLSENGQNTIRHFTTKNSPLISDDIMAIAIHPVSGEVFFGTSNGLISYQSDAAAANDVFRDVHVYPNPIRENYKGLISITGLVEKTIVKITDVTGNLIAETISNGSIATWDGKNKFGQRVSTGVYLALCLSPDGQQQHTAKMLVIN